jgi:phage shock protein PspC (stress-responsive transcriptional regulator)
MNKVITIHLHGTAFQLEEAGYEALRVYLDTAARRLEGNPDKDEIIADIEQAIADKCRAVLGAYKNVVITQEITQIIGEMGPVQDAAAEGEERPAGAGATAAAGPEAAGAPPPPVRRLYKIHDGAMIAGVCNGIAVYAGIDPTIVRLLFVLLTFFWGFAILVYLILMVILPSPKNAAEKAAAYGVAATAQEFIRRAREGYYEGMRTFRDRHAHREWRRQFKREMKGWGRRLRDEARAHAYRAAASAVPPSWAPGPPPACMPPAAPSFGLLFILPLVALLRAALAVVCFFSVISLLATRTVFGVAPPATMPLWVALVLLLVFFAIISWPLKALRHAWYWHAARGPVFVPPLFWAVDAIVGLGCAVLLIWLIDRFVPGAHAALQAIPVALHHAVDTVRQWWAAP